MPSFFRSLLKTKNFHWHLSGPHFRDYHLLFDEQGDQLFAMTDAIAERIRKVGGTTIRSIGHITRLQRVLDNDAAYVEPEDMLEELREDSKTLASRLREAHDVCEEHEDIATASLIEVWIDATERRTWFLFEASRCEVNAVKTMRSEQQAGQEAKDTANEKSGFIAYPTDKVVGFIDDAGDANAALRDLRVVGFTQDAVQLLTGEEGARRIDVKGADHGLLARILRSTQELLGDYEIPDARRHEQELLAGHFGIGVSVKREKDREKVREILKSHNGHFINFYGRWIRQPFDP